MGVVGKWWTAQRLLGDRPRGQNNPDTLGAHPRLRAHCLSHTLPQVVVHPIFHALQL